MPPILADVDWTNIMICLTIILVVISSLLYSFFIKRIKHKEIMAAIEKGISLPQLEEAHAKIPRWITNISIGIGFLIVSLLVLTEFLYDLIRRNDFGYNVLLFFGVLFAIGVVFLVRGLLQRKIQR